LQSQRRPVFDQMVMHRAGRQQRVDRQMPFTRIAVGQQQHQLAGAHGGLGLVAERSSARSSESGRVVEVDELVA
jgi:hypothetical protein